MTPATPLFDLKGCAELDRAIKALRKTSVAVSNSNENKSGFFVSDENALLLLTRSDIIDALGTTIGTIGITIPGNPPSRTPYPGPPALDTPISITLPPTLPITINPPNLPPITITNPPVPIINPTNPYLPPKLPVGIIILNPGQSPIYVGGGGQSGTKTLRWDFAGGSGGNFCETDWSWEVSWGGVVSMRVDYSGYVSYNGHSSFDFEWYYWSGSSYTQINLYNDVFDIPPDSNYRGPTTVNWTYTIPSGTSVLFKIQQSGGKTYTFTLTN